MKAEEKIDNHSCTGSEATARDRLAPISVLQAAAQELMCPTEQALHMRFEMQVRRHRAASHRGCAAGLLRAAQGQKPRRCLHKPGAWGLVPVAGSQAG